MKLTFTQKRAIRAHWAAYDLRFTADGTVMARAKVRRAGDAWGVLYHPRDTQAHIDSLTANYREIVQKRCI